MEKRKKQDGAVRLLAYSTAAGLGAFGFGQVSQGAIVHVDIPDTTLASGETFHINIDGDIYNDLLFQNLNTFRFKGIYGSIDYTNSPDKGNDYYNRSFDTGDLISSGTATYAVGALSGSDWSSTSVPAYGGFLFEDAGNVLHWGWVRVSTDNGADTMTIYEYAYETDPSSTSDIAAGAVPEPALGLLAAGLGALGLRRRSA